MQQDKKLFVFTVNCNDNNDEKNDDAHGSTNANIDQFLRPQR